MGVALHFSLQLANHNSQWSDFGAVCKANNGTLSLAEFFDEIEGHAILEGVAFLLRLSINASGKRSNKDMHIRSLA